MLYFRGIITKLNVFKSDLVFHFLKIQSLFSEQILIIISSMPLSYYQKCQISLESVRFLFETLFVRILKTYDIFNKKYCHFVKSRVWDLVLFALLYRICHYLTIDCFVLHNSFFEKYSSLKLLRKLGKWKAILFTFEIYDNVRFPDGEIF